MAGRPTLLSQPSLPKERLLAEPSEAIAPPTTHEVAPELPEAPGAQRAHSTEASGEGAEKATDKVSLQTTISNMVLSVLGAGQLTLPYALSQLGMGAGLAALIVFTLFSAHSCWTLSVHARKLQLDSYPDLVVNVLGERGRGLCNSMIAIYAWGGGVGFLMILKGELRYLAAQTWLAHINHIGMVAMLFVSCLVILPLSCLRNVSRLKVLSPLGCLAAIFIMITVLLCAPWGSMESCTGPASSEGTLTHDAGPLLWMPQSLLEVAATLPLLAFALNSSWAFMPILKTLERQTAKRVVGLIGFSNSVILINYLLLATVGYFMFCSDTHANILESLGEHVERNSWRGGLVCLARAALAFQLSIGLPLRFVVTRDAMGGSQWSTFKRVGVSFLIVGSAVALAWMVQSLAIVLGVVSSICASLIIYILPAIIDIASDSKWAFRKSMSVLSLGVGLFIMIGGLVANFYGVAQGS